MHARHAGVAPEHLTFRLLHVKHARPKQGASQRSERRDNVGTFRTCGECWVVPLELPSLCISGAEKGCHAEERWVYRKQNVKGDGWVEGETRASGEEEEHNVAGAAFLSYVGSSAKEVL